MEKICKKCGLKKDLSEFKKHPETVDKRTGDCKVCINKNQRIRRAETGNLFTHVYEKTHKGFLVRLYRNMLSRISGVQSEKFHLYEGKDILPKEDFYKWAISNSDFIKLFDAYKGSGYDRKLTPSVDRIKSELGYTLDNMRFITHSENSRLGTLSKGIKGKIQAFKNGVLIGTYDGLQPCMDATGVSLGSISNVVSGKAKKAKGYSFKRINDDKIL